LVAGVLALGILGWLHFSGSEPAPQPPTVLPDPDTSGMTAPVARAIRKARQAALAAPGSGAATGRYCQVLHAHWLYVEAAACYEIARALAPEDFRWVYLLAGVEDVRGEDGERIDRLFIDAIRLAPGFPPAHVRRADALMRLGRWSEARESYALAAELDPGLILAHRGRGQAAILLGDGPAAVEHLERAASLAPGDRITQTALARAYTLIGQSELAVEAARKARELTGEAGLPDAVYYQVEVLRVDPQTLRERFARAMREGDREQALEAAALLEESGAPGATQQLAAALKQRANQLAFAGEFERALAEYGRAAELAPNDPEIQHNWGTVLLRRGDLEEAGRRFEKAIELDPRSADSLYNLGVVLEGLGHDDKAITRFKEAAAIDPNHVAAQRLAELGATPEP
jgi:tetratricopeptide (TPR) repeat protein